MSDKDLAKDLAAVTVYVVGWLLAVFSFAVALGLFIGIVTKVSRVVAG
jgi:hypothetical protein